MKTDEFWKKVEAGDFVQMTGWPRALVDNIDFKQRIVSLQFREDGDINDYTFNELAKLRKKIV